MMEWSKDGDQWVARGSAAEEYRITEWNGIRGADFLLTAAKRGERPVTISGYTSLREAKRAALRCEGFYPLEGPHLI